NSRKAAKDFSDLNKTGTIVFNAIGNNAVRAFKAMGDGSQTAAEAIRGAVLGAVADTAEAKGTEMMLAGIWPPNPAAIAGGGALIALSSALRAQGGASTGGG